MGREVGDIDVLSSHFIQMSKYDVETDFLSLEPIADIDLLPTVFERFDSENHGVAFWGNQSGIAYDSNRIDEADLPQTMDELEAFMAENPNGFGVNDPSMGGSGQSFIQSVVRDQTGTGDYFDGESVQSKLDDMEAAFTWLEEQPITWTGSNADSLTRLNDGEFLLVPAWEDQLAGLQREGELGANLSIYIPEFGMNGGKNLVSIPANAENPAAAMVFIDWLTSADTQSALNETFGSAPQHPDASDAFALIDNSQRANSTEWFSVTYTDFLVETVTERVVGG